MRDSSAERPLRPYITEQAAQRQNSQADRQHVLDIASPCLAIPVLGILALRLLVVM